jgi:hypothetical protein
VLAGVNVVIHDTSIAMMEDLNAGFCISAADVGQMVSL